MKLARWMMAGMAALMCAGCEGGNKPGAATGVAPTSRPVVAAWEMRAAPADRVNLVSFGDWGGADKELKVVAGALAQYVAGRGEQFNAALLAGDNFYVPIKSIDDPLWGTTFEQMYDASKLNFPFYAALGNHDYQGGKAKIEADYAVAHPESRWKMPSRYYRVDFPRENPLVTVLMLDSNKDKFTKEEWAAQIDWMDQQLAAAAGRWTIACAHHPLFSNGTHGDIGPLQLEWGPVFQTRKLAFYVCGHDHDLQHLEVPGWSTSFVLAGGGGRKPRDMRRDNRGPFSRSLNGFAHFEITADRAEVNFVDKGGTIVHAFERTAAGQVKTTVEGTRDAPTTKPLKALGGFEDEVKEKEKAAGEK